MRFGWVKCRELFILFYYSGWFFWGGGSSRGIMVRVRLVNQKFAGSSRRYGRDCRWWSECPALFPTEVRPSTKPPIAPRVPQHWLPTAPGGVHSVCLFVCVHFSQLCVCALGWVKCRARVPSMGHPTWRHVTSFPFHFSILVAPSGPKWEAQLLIIT